MVLMRYRATEPGMLNLDPKDKVVVYSYPAGDNPNLLGVEVSSQHSLASMSPVVKWAFLGSFMDASLGLSWGSSVLLRKIWSVEVQPFCFIILKGCETSL